MDVICLLEMYSQGDSPPGHVCIRHPWVKYKNNCGICFQQLSNYGLSQVICLKCGHIFCYQCIMKSLDVGFEIGYQS